jgi:hypothetical protein
MHVYRTRNSLPWWIQISLKFELERSDSALHSGRFCLQFQLKSRLYSANKVTYFSVFIGRTWTETNSAGGYERMLKHYNKTLLLMLTLCFTYLCLELTLTAEGNSYRLRMMFSVSPSLTEHHHHHHHTTVVFLMMDANNIRNMQS